MGLTLLEAASIFCAGLLAGAEVVIRYGIRNPIRMLPDAPGIVFRQAIARTLRILMPALLAPTVLTSIAVLVSNAAGIALLLRLAAVIVLLGWIAITFLGTVPINEAILTWDPLAPPDNWTRLIRRWERLDTVRTWAAIAVFALLVAATCFSACRN